MTREEAKKFLPLIQAFAEGKTIQARFKDDKDDPWEEIVEPAFLGEASLEYRIKPEPKVIFVNEYCGQSTYAAWDTLEQALSYAGEAVRKAVKYVEVIE